MNRLWNKYNWPALFGAIAVAIATTLHLYTASVPFRHALIQTISAVLMAIGTFFMPPQRSVSVKGKANGRQSNP